MKTLALKTTVIKKDGENFVTWKDFAKSCLDFVSQERGIKPDEMRKRFRVLDALDRATDTLEIEDADVTTLKSCVSEMSWAVSSRDILEFTDAVVAL